MKKINSAILVISFGLFYSCSSKQLAPTIDNTLQAKVTSILENKLSEINAKSGQVIIMEVQTGQITDYMKLEQ